MPSPYVALMNSFPILARSRAGWLLGAAGVALLAAQAVLPAFPDGTAQQVSVATAHRDGVMVSALAFLLAGVLLVLGTTALNQLALDRGRTLTRIGLILTGLGALWPVAGRASYNAILVAVTGNTDHSTAVSAVHAVSNSAAFSAFLPLLAAFVIGPVLLALGLRRAGALPIWPAVMWFVGVVIVNAAESSSRVVASVGMALVAAALGWIGRVRSSV